MSCSPSASARTVTAHSLNAIGIGDPDDDGNGTRRSEPVAPGQPATRTTGTGDIVPQVMQNRQISLLIGSFCLCVAARRRRMAADAARILPRFALGARPRQEPKRVLANASSASM